MRISFKPQRHYVERVQREGDIHSTWVVVDSETGEREECMTSIYASKLASERNNPPLTAEALRAAIPEVEEEYPISRFVDPGRNILPDWVALMAQKP